MKNFARVVRSALRYRYSIALSVICSVMVGILWGANIAALYPFVEVVFRGESFHDWADRQVADRQKACDELTGAIALVRRQDVDAEPEQENDPKATVALKEANLAKAQKALARAHKYQWLIKRAMPDDPFLDLVWVVGAMMLGTALKSAFLVGNIILVARVRDLAVADLRNELFAKTLKLDLATFGVYRTSGLLSRFTHDMRILESGFEALLGQAIREPLKMIVCLIGAAFISWRLLLLSLLITPLGLLLMRRLTKAMKRTSGRSMDVIAELYARLSEAFNGIKVVKASTMENHECRRFAHTTREYVRRRMRFTAYLAFLKPVTEIMGLAVVSVAILAGAYMVLNQETHILGVKISGEPLSATLLLVFFGMLAGVADPGRKMSDIYATLIAGIAASDRICGLLDQVPAVADPPEPRSVPRPHRELILEHVSFHYRREEPVLRDISLRIPLGETVALAGPNGCGKSTLANLIPRFFDPIQGSVRLDDVELAQMRLADLRDRIGLVTQETLLFDDTIMNNIRYGAPDATDEQVIQASQRAHAHRFITQDLEQGYETIIGQSGGRLSGGQRQRIALARAILRDPEILILDEATSQIDVESEKLIHQALEEFVRGRTAIVISHRLSMLRLADRIVVMEAGRIVGCGTHDELLASCPDYRRLHRTQLSDAA
ncbi:MAG: hypothetical protein A2V98_01275 [Planctomycetes bacterium RBG_16_64_12]|nr:MAG: hypothetical protein A2V98_01275 [Planctomycetes bacterium RBG_16_64_12]